MFQSTCYDLRVSVCFRLLSSMFLSVFIYCIIIPSISVYYPICVSVYYTSGLNVSQCPSLSGSMCLIYCRYIRMSQDDPIAFLILVLQTEKKIRFLPKNGKFKLQINLDRRGPRLLHCKDTISKIFNKYF